VIDLLRILVAPLVWLASFSAVYGLHGLACAQGWGGAEMAGVSLARLLLSFAWLGAIAVQVAILVGLHSERLASPSGFVRRVSRTMAWVGLAATVWSLFPVVATSSCG
jgi:hypothetical protein